MFVEIVILAVSSTLIILTLLAFLDWLLWLTQALGPHREGDLGPLFLAAVRAEGMPLMLLICVGVGFRAAGSVTAEKEGQTLVSLLTLPMERKAILGAKWLASLLGMRRLAWCLAATWGVGVISGALHPGAVVLLAAATLAFSTFFASLGIAFSTICGSTLRANVLMALAMLAVLGRSVWLLFDPLVIPSTGAETFDWGRNLLTWGLDPARACWFLSFSWTECRQGLETPDHPFAKLLAVVLVGMFLFQGAAWLCWWCACRRFDHEDGGGR